MRLRTKPVQPRYIALAFIEGSVRNEVWQKYLEP
jgi:hypothetical protein